MISEAEISKNYNQTDLLDKIKLCLSDMDINPSELTTKDLSLFDQMHLGGSAAVKIVSQALNLNKNSNVLDLGCGLGGPARLIAEINNSKVEGIDLMPSYINDTLNEGQMKQLCGGDEIEGRHLHSDLVRFTIPPFEAW